MSADHSLRDPWRWPAAVLWFVFFLLGLWPELTFDLLRMAGYVFSQNAIINSYNFITWALTAFVAHFVYHRSIEAELPPIEALGKAMQLGILAFVAFIDLPVELIPDTRYLMDRVLIMGTVGFKLLVWLYLYSLIFRYYWTGRAEVVAGALPWLALTLPPSPKATEKKRPDTAEPEERASVEHTAD